MNGDIDETQAIRSVAVLMGGRSAEREVSLNTGGQVAGALADRGLNVATIDSAYPGFIEELRTLAPDAVFICLHGRFGEDGTVQGLLELLDLPYVGSGVLASALAMDKVMSKRVYGSSGILTPAWTTVRRGEDLDVEAVTALLGPKTVVKPACEGSAIGVGIVHDPSELAPAVSVALEHDTEALIERFEAGVEVTVGVLGNDDPVALPTLQVVPEHEFYDYESKYVPGMSRHIIPADVSEKAREECSRVGIRAHLALGCAGLSRSDTIVTGTGEVFLLETNTIPGMTSTSLFPDAAAAAGIAFPELCERLVVLGVERFRSVRGR